MEPKDGYRKVKDLTNDYVMDYYIANGLDNTVALCKSFLTYCKKAKYESGFKANLRGEVCETVLEIYILEFMKKYPRETKDWFIEKGMVLKNKDNDEFLTEIDVTLFTSYKILTFECKSYGGDKVFIDKCTVHRSFTDDKDVYAQHELHYSTLINNIKLFKINTPESKKVAPLQIAYFDFSIGTIEDKRDMKWRRLMPVITINNIHRLLKTYLDKPECWELNKLQEHVKYITRNKERDTRKHLDYVRQLHGND